MSAQKLQQTIDRLVESAIRRILPGVMNEVLLRTIADSGVLAERVARPSAAPRPAAPRGTVQPRRQPTPQRPRTDLTQLLDESAGADAYERWDRQSPGRPTPTEPEEAYGEIDADEGAADTPQAEMTQRLSGLDPAIRAMAEGIDLSDDGDGEMWGEGEHDATSVVPDLPPVRDLGEAARRVGIDFSRMADTIRAAPATKADPADMKARVQFEERRLKLLRERLNDGKPVE